MAQAYIERTLEPVLKKAVSQFPAVVLTGPRQSGKTTLLKHLFIRQYRYVSLEVPDVRAAAVEDPRGFLERTSTGTEVDLIIHAEGKLVPIEVKLSATPQPKMAQSIRSFQEDHGERSAAGFVVHPAGPRLPLAPNVSVLPFSEL